MNWSKWIRQFHRWMAVIFTTIVLVIFTILGSGQEPERWLYLLPLYPLFLLMLTGLYMFVLPYVARWRGRQRVGAEEVGK